MSHRRDPLPTDVATLSTLPAECDAVLDGGLVTIESTGPRRPAFPGTRRRGVIAR